eukprot:572715-Prorocentrum_minimum.AAC.4
MVAASNLPGNVLQMFTEVVYPLMPHFTKIVLEYTQRAGLFQLETVVTISTKALPSTDLANKVTNNYRVIQRNGW